MKAKDNLQKRKPRSYKATDQIYQDAMKRAKKDGTTLANVIENILTSYASGAKAIFKSKF